MSNDWKTNGRLPAVPGYLGTLVPDTRPKLRRHLESIQTQERAFENCYEQILEVATPLKPIMKASAWAAYYGEDMAHCLRVIDALRDRRAMCQARLFTLSFR